MDAAAFSISVNGLQRDLIRAATVPYLTLSLVCPPNVGSDCGRHIGVTVFVPGKGQEGPVGLEQSANKTDAWKRRRVCVRGMGSREKGENVCEGGG